ncbi:hypothetical protein BDF19DRAFT_203020 [Syncephalis fuscata]|nr:hypothetical protein BDF19DRAFT_203020 [Syncephalis fuscata]
MITNRLARMTEFEREQVLHERAERRQQLIERAEVKRKLKTSERRHGGSSSDKRRSTRIVPASDEQSRGISELKRRREEKQSRSWRDHAYDDDDNERGDGNDDDDDYYYGGGNSTNKRRSRSPRDHRSRSQERQQQQQQQQSKRTSTLDELNTVRMTRDMIEKWAHTPFFEQAVIGSFIRASIGPGPDGNMVYRICRVEKLDSQSRSYMVGAITTNLVLNCSHGKANKVFKMDTISNGPCTQREYDRYMGTLKHEQLKPITLSDVERKQKDLEFARNYVLNDQEVEEMVKVKQSLIMFNPTLEKSQLIRERERAVMNGEQETVKRYDTEIAEIDRILEAQTNERQRALQQLNERNRKLNLMEIRKAEEDIRRQRRKEIEEHHQQLAKAAAAANASANEADGNTTMADISATNNAQDSSLTAQQQQQLVSSSEPLANLSSFEQMIAGASQTTLDVDLDELLA